MTELLHFPDDETKAFRRARAEAIARAERGARIVASYVELLDDLMASRPRRFERYPALDLARWITDVSALLNEIKREPAQVRMDAAITGRCLKLKGLVDEAQMESFVTVKAADLRGASDHDVRAAIAEVTRNISGEGLTSLDMAREVNDDLKARCDASLKIVTDELAENPVLTIHGNGDVSLGRLRVPYRSQPTPPQIRGADLTLPQGEGGRGASRLAPGQAATGARRAPGAPDAPASLTPGLLSRSPQLSGGVRPAAGKTARAATPPSSSVAARVVLMTCVGRSVGTEPVLGIADGDTRGLRPSRLLRWLFHAARMRLREFFVTEKRNGHFSGGKPGGRT